MRIACDVKGTLDCPRGPVILEALNRIQKLGHQCVVWSNLVSYALDAITQYDLKDVEAQLKFFEFDSEPESFFDVAIEDDRRQDYLAAHNFIFVDEITDADSLVARILFFNRDQ